MTRAQRHDSALELGSGITSLAWCAWPEVSSAKSGRNWTRYQMRKSAVHVWKAANCEQNRNYTTLALFKCKMHCGIRRQSEAYSYWPERRRTGEYLASHDELKPWLSKETWHCDQLKRFTQPPFNKTEYGLNRMAGDPLDANLLQMRKYYSASNGNPDWESRKEVRRRRDMTKQRTRLACMEIRICARARRGVLTLIGPQQFEIRIFSPCQPSTRMSQSSCRWYYTIAWC